MDEEKQETKTELSETQEPEQKYELTPEAATSFENITKGTVFLNRRRVLMILIITFSTIIGGGFIFNNIKGKKSVTKKEVESDYASSPTDMLSSMRDRALRNQATSDLPPEIKEELVNEGLPVVRFDDSGPRRVPVYAPREQYPDPPPQSYGSGQPDPLLAAYRSSLVPQMQGSLFNSGQPVNMQQNNPQNQYNGQQNRPSSSSSDYLQSALNRMSGLGAGGTQYINNLPPSPYAEQNAQDNKQSFYNSDAGGGNLGGGNYIPDNSLWIGTIIPGVLETAINTDLPGNVLARVTQNIYDSRTGKALLVPQGTILVAKYNSSVSYAQHRVQIVWDTLIRPDGYHLELEGMNSVDKKGMSGQKADYHENWFEYLKAAGIIALFSIANAKMVDTVAKYAKDLTASGVAQASSEFVNEVGSNFVGRAMNIQPTLTVDSGTLINIMLNKNIFLPPLKDFQAKKYILE